MELVEIIKKMDELRDELDALRPIPIDRINRLNQKLRLDWNYHSNSIEGNTLTASETKAFILHGITAKGKPFRDYIEMRGHNDALKKLEEIVHHDLKITENLIKEFHKIILVEPYSGEAEINPGEYKTQANYLYSTTGERIDFEPPQEVPRLMNELINWLNNHIDPPKRKKKKYDLHPLLIASGFHVRFIQIHPFGDGNGRMARILMNLILMLCGYVPAVIRLENRKTYYSALNLSSLDNADLLAEFIGEECIKSLEIAVKAAKGESIEDVNDIDKEIALWKQKATLKKVTTSHRDDKEVYEIYSKGVKELFEEFESKHKQFYELFRKASCFTYRNNGGREGFEWLSEEIDKIVLKTEGIFLAEGEAPEIIPPDDTFQNIYIKINLVEFKHSEVAFSVYPILRIEFEPYRYEIKYAGKKITKFYGEYLSAEEREQIIVESVKATFTEIKSKTV